MMPESLKSVLKYVRCPFPRIQQKINFLIYQKICTYSVRYIFGIIMLRRDNL